MSPWDIFILSYSMHGLVAKAYLHPVLRKRQSYTERERERERETEREREIN